jgi:hypothetical protein
MATQKMKCPLCEVEFDWNLTIKVPNYCPNCSEQVSTRDAELDRRGVPVSPLARKGGFAVGHTITQWV